MWFQSKQMSTEAPTEASTCRSRGPNGELIERPYDYVIASRSLRGKITKLEVAEDFESQYYTRQSLLLEKETERSRNGGNKKCQKHYQASAEEGCQEEEKQKKAGKKKMKRRSTEKDR